MTRPCTTTPSSPPRPFAGEGLRERVLFGLALPVLIATLLCACSGSMQRQVIGQHEELIESIHTEPKRQLLGDITVIDREPRIFLHQSCEEQVVERVALYQDTIDEPTIELSESWALFAGVSLLFGVVGLVCSQDSTGCMDSVPSAEELTQQQEDMEILGIVGAIGAGVFGIAALGFYAWEQPSAAQHQLGPVQTRTNVVRVPCDATPLPPLEGQTIQLITGSGRVVSELNLATDLSAPFPIGNLSRSEVETPAQFGITVLATGETAHLENVNPHQLAEIWNRHSPDRPLPLLRTEIGFSDATGNSNGVLDAEEGAELHLIIINDGEGWANNVTLNVDAASLPDWVQVAATTHVGDIAPNDVESLTLAIRAGRVAEQGDIELRLETLEQAGFDGSPIVIRIPIDRFRPSQLTMLGVDVDDLEMGDGNGRLDPNERVELVVHLRNDGETYAELTGELFSTAAGQLLPSENPEVRLEPGDTHQLRFSYLLSARDARGLEDVLFSFRISDRRTDTTTPHSVRVPIGAFEDRTIVVGPSAGESEIPEQRVFLMDFDEEDADLLESARPTFQSVLTSDGRITIATHRENQVAIANCMDSAGIDPTQSRRCEIEWANRQLFDWALRLDLHQFGENGNELVLEVYNPQQAEMVFTAIEDVGDATDLRPGVRAVGRSFRRWLAQSAQLDQ